METELQGTESTARPQRGLKALWVVLAVLTVFCGGGILVIGALFFKTQGAVTESLTYGDQSLLAIGKEWDPRSLRERMSPHIGKSPAELESATKDVCSKLKAQFGPIKPATPSSRILHVGAYTSNQIGSYKLVRYQAEAEFEKAWGVVNMQLIDQGGAWKIWSFYVKPGRVSNGQ